MGVGREERPGADLNDLDGYVTILATNHLLNHLIHRTNTTVHLGHSSYLEFRDPRGWGWHLVRSGRQHPKHKTAPNSWESVPAWLHPESLPGGYLPKYSPGFRVCLSILIKSVGSRTGECISLHSRS